MLKKASTEAVTSALSIPVFSAIWLITSALGHKNFWKVAKYGPIVQTQNEFTDNHADDFGKTNNSMEYEGF